jgi:N-acylneuraminate cytidylyltransferase
LVPARGGSKRLPRKNIKLLDGRPLLAWTLDISSNILEIEKTLVSTDDPEIAKIAEEYGGWAPWLRPKQLAGDTATSVEVTLHALDWFELTYGEVDGILLLQPTSPFRCLKRMRQGISLFVDSNFENVVGVSPSKSHPAWTFMIDDQTMTPFIPDQLNCRSQDLQESFSLNGSFFIVSPTNLREHQSFYSPSMLPLVSDWAGESIDIDTEFDWMVAERFSETLRAK